MWHRRTPWPSLRALIEHEDRRTREDLIASFTTVVYCLLARLDLKSLRVGWPRTWHADGRTHDFAGLPRETIAKWCGLSEVTVSRVLTAMRRAGLVCGPSLDGVNHIAQPRELTDDGHGWRAFPAIRRFTVLFFAGLGESDDLAELRTSRPRPPTPKGLPVGGVHPNSAAALIGALANTHALERPPD